MANEPIVEPIGEPVVEPVKEPATPVPVSLKDDDLVEVVVQGQKVTKPWKDARAGIQMNEDYTRKTQAVAQQAKELQELFDGLTAKQKQLLEKETAIDTILGRTPQNKEVTPAPDEVITYAQLQAALKDQATALDQRHQSTMAEIAQRNEEARNWQRWEDLTTQATDSLVKEHPVLADIPQLSLVLKREAMKDKPTCEKELVEAIVKAGKSTADKLEKGYTERKKAEAIKRQNLTLKGPEQSRGTPQLAPTKKTYGSGRKVNWNEIEQDVIAALETAED